MFSKSSKNFLSSIEFKMFYLFNKLFGLKTFESLKGVTGAFESLGLMFLVMNGERGGLNDCWLLAC